MKLIDKTKKRLTLAGLGVLSVVLVVAIAAQFRTGTPMDRQADASSTASDASVPSISAPGATGSSPDVSVPAVSAPDTASQNGSAKDTGDSSGTTRAFRQRSQNRPSPRRKRKRTQIRRRTAKRLPKRITARRPRIPPPNHRHRNPGIKKTERFMYPVLDGLQITAVEDLEQLPVICTKTETKSAT